VKFGDAEKVSSAVGLAAQLPESDVLSAEG
jgi:hypothetical protein